MSLAEKSPRTCRSLRRFARLLTGSQQAGDAAVARVLEAIVADPRCFPTCRPASASTSAFSTPSRRGWRTRPRRPTRSAQPRRARWRPCRPGAPGVLLVSVEEFDRREAAQILEVRSGRIDELLRASQQRDRQADRDRRADHRGRAADRARPAKDPAGSRPSRHLDRAHAQGRVEGGGAAEAGAGAGRHPAGGRQLRARRGQRHPGQLHRAGGVRHRLSRRSS